MPLLLALVAVAHIAVTLVLALATRLSNIGAVVVTAQTACRRNQAAAEAARRERWCLLVGLDAAAGVCDVADGRLDGRLAHLLLEVLAVDVRRDAGLDFLFPQLLLGINHGVAVAALLLGVARADAVAGAAATGRAAAAAGVALPDAHLAAHFVAAGEAGNGVVADGGRG